MRECTILVHRNYAEGMTASAYYSEEDARGRMTEDIESVIEKLRDEGYSPQTVENGWDHVEISAADENIYYEWNIIIAEIQ